jgi:ribonuclease-3
MDKIQLRSLEKKLNYKFNNKQLLINAITHKTYAFEAKKPLEYNERLEFLGDSILNFIISEKLYKINKYFSEGELTRHRAIYVNNVFLADIANKLDIGKFLLLGKGEKQQKGNINPRNLANALESIIGAIYLDSNLDNVRNIILNNILNSKIEF